MGRPHSTPFNTYTDYCSKDFSAKFKTRLSNISHLETETEANFENLKHKLTHATRRSQPNGTQSISVKSSPELNSCVATESRSVATWVGLQGGVRKGESFEVMGMLMVVEMVSRANTCEPLLNCTL